MVQVDYIQLLRLYKGIETLHIQLIAMPAKNTDMNL